MTDKPTSLHAMCDPTEQMAARVRELEADNARLREKVRSLGTEGHAYREGKIAGMTKANARAEAAEAELARVRALPSAQDGGAAYLCPNCGSIQSETCCNHPGRFVPPFTEEDFPNATAQSGEEVDSTAYRLRLAEAEHDALKAEVERLSDALRECVIHCQNTGRGSALVNDRIYERVEETARAALATLARAAEIEQEGE